MNYEDEEEYCAWCWEYCDECGCDDECDEDWNIDPQENIKRQVIEDLRKRNKEEQKMENEQIDVEKLVEALSKIVGVLWEVDILEEESRNDLRELISEIMPREKTIIDKITEGFDNASGDHVGISRDEWSEIKELLGSREG